MIQKRTLNVSFKRREGRDVITVQLKLINITYEYTIMLQYTK